MGVQVHAVRRLTARTKYASPVLYVFKSDGCVWKNKLKRLYCGNNVPDLRDRYSGRRRRVVTMIIVRPACGTAPFARSLIQESKNKNYTRAANKRITIIIIIIIIIIVVITVFSHLHPLRYLSRARVPRVKLRR